VVHPKEALMNTNMNRTLATVLSVAALFALCHSPAAAGGGEPNITVSRLIVATEVSDREPVGAATEFSLAETSHLFAFVEVENPDAQPAEVLVNWIDPTTGKTRSPFTLTIGAGKRWRTWMRAAAPKQPGSYEVEVTDALGNLLARTSFTITQ
jgi:hypothetical protein